MAKKKERQEAIKLRLEGKSYSEIKNTLNLSKSTLSYWLRDYPLPKKRIKELRDNNPRRIERFRETMRRKREEKIERAYSEAKRDISKCSKRDLFVAGFFLYWGEGTKTSTTTSVANTDPSMLKIFIKWLELLGVKREKLKAKLHLYSDMNVEKETKFWSRELNIPLNKFRKPYIKKTRLNYVNYSKGGFKHGTCNVILENREITDYILGGIRYLSEEFS